jgi:hypothetical protein
VHTDSFMHTDKRAAEAALLCRPMKTCGAN